MSPGWWCARSSRTHNKSRERPTLVDPAPQRHLALHCEQDHLTLFTWDTQHQDLRGEAGDITGPEIDSCDDQVANQFLGTVEGSDLRARGFFSQRPKIHP